MQEDDRIVEKYLGYELVAVFRGTGIYLGRAWKGGQGLADVEGKSLQDVIKKLRQTIDSPKFQTKLKQILIEKHGEFLRRKGISLENISAHELSNSYDRNHRSTLCYECGSRIDNEIDLECPRCRWIVCANCGACGCGHPKYGPEVSRRLFQRQHPGLLQDVPEARSLASESHRHGKSGDTLRCKACGNERVISQAWIDDLMRRYYPASAGRSTTLDLQIVTRLKCSECNGKSWQLVEASVDATAKTYTLCPACGGDGGTEGSCYKCFGTGFNADEMNIPARLTGPSSGDSR